MMSSHELVLGGLPLAGPDNALTGEGFVIRVLSSGTKFGSPEAVVQTVAALAGDGAVARNEGFGNATSPLTLQVRGADYAALAAGERALRRVLPDGWGDPADLVYRPPGGPASVRTVIRGVLGSPFEADKWDDQELRLGRTFPVTIEHLPFVRSEFETVAPAMPDGGAVSTVWAGTSATGMATDPAGGLNDETGSGRGVYTEVGYRLAWQGSYATGTRRWITVSGASVSGFQQQVNARPAQMIINGQAHQVAPAYRDALTTTYRLPETGVITQIKWQLPPTGAWQRDRVAKIESRENPPSFGRQSLRRIEVGGTERTPGTIRVSARDGVTPVGLTLVHTSPAASTAYGPDLNPWFFSGADFVINTGSLMGGYREMSTSTGVICHVPASSLPSDTYELAMVVTPAVGGTFNFGWSASSITALTPHGVSSGSRVVSLSSTQMNFVSLGRVTLPTAVTRDGSTVISFALASAPGVVRVHGMYAFRAGRNCGLTVIDSTEPNVFISSESPGQPATHLVGAAADGSNAYCPAGDPAVGGSNKVLSPGEHNFLPGPMSVFVGTTTSINAATELKHYRRFSHNAANDGTT